MNSSRLLGLLVAIALRLVSLRWLGAGLAVAIWNEAGRGASQLTRF